MLDQLPCLALIANFWEENGRLGIIQRIASILKGAEFIKEEKNETPILYCCCLGVDSERDPVCRGLQ